MSTKSASNASARIVNTAAQSVRIVNTAAQSVRIVNTAAQSVRIVNTAAQSGRIVNTAARMTTHPDILCSVTLNDWHAVFEVRGSKCTGLRFQFCTL